MNARNFLYGLALPGPRGLPSHMNVDFVEEDDDFEEPAKSGGGALGPVAQTADMWQLDKGPEKGVAKKEREKREQEKQRRRSRSKDRRKVVSNIYRSSRMYYDLKKCYLVDTAVVVVLLQNVF